MWLLGVKELAPVVWRVKWSQEVKDRLITFNNPNEDIINSNLGVEAQIT